MGALFGANGPPVQAFVLSHRVSEPTRRATQACIRALAGLSRLISLLTAPGDLLSLHEWPVYAVLITGGLAGLFAGNACSGYLSGGGFAIYTVLCLPAF
jgi:hypothetical protein